MAAWHEAKWDAPGESTKRRRFRWGWLWLLVIPVALITFSVGSYNNYWQFADFTVSTLVCEEPLPEEADWAAIEAAGCTEGAIPGADITLLEVGREAGEDVRTDGTTWEFTNVQSAFSTMSINVMFEEPVGRAYTVDAEANPPAVLRELNGDKARRTFSQHLKQGDSTKFYVAVGAPEN